MTYSLGRVVEHDPRSRQIEFRAAQAPLRTISHRNWQKHPLDQGNIGGCVGWSMAQQLNTTPLRAKGRRLLGNADGLKLYSRATQLDEFPGEYPPDDSGTSGLAGAKAAKDAGYISAYHHAFGVDQALGALVLSPICIGVGWRDSMWEADGNGYLDISGSVVGGHEVAVIAIDTRRERITLLNQWWENGKPWGINGRAYLRFTDFGTLLADQGDVTVAVL